MPRRTLVARRRADRSGRGSRSEPRVTRGGRYGTRSPGVEREIPPPACPLLGASRCFSGVPAVGIGVIDGAACVRSGRARSSWPTPQGRRGRRRMRGKIGIGTLPASSARYDDSGAPEPTRPFASRLRPRPLVPTPRGTTPLRVVAGSNTCSLSWRHDALRRHRSRGRRRRRRDRLVGRRRLRGRAALLREDQAGRGDHRAPAPRLGAPASFPSAPWLPRHRRLGGVARR